MKAIRHVNEDFAAPPVAFYICPEKIGVKKKKDSHISVRLLSPYLEKQGNKQKFFNSIILN